MPKPSIEDQIQARVQAFADELSELVRAAALEAVEQVLGGQASSLMAAPTRRKKVARASGGKGKRVRRTAAALEEDKATLLAHVSSHPGQRLEEIASGLGVDSKGLKRPVALLLEAKRLRKEGQRRGTRYFAAGRGGGEKKAPAKKAPARKAPAKKAPAKKTSRKKRAARK